MNINIIAVGKLKEKYLRDAQTEYSKRIGGFGKINITEISECKLPENPSDGEINSALGKEGAEILAKSRSGVRIALCIEGKKYSSEALAALFERLSLDGKSTLHFIIGSSHGLSDDVKSSADYSLSMSDMTFPHQLARIMLLEQIYRAFSIISGKKYHK